MFRRREVPERVDHIHVDIIFDSAQYKKHQDDIRKVMDADRTFNVIPGDNFVLNWKFNLMYFNIVQQMSVIRNILEDDELIFDVKLTSEEIDSLFLDFISDIRRCQEAIKRRAST